MRFLSKLIVLVIEIVAVAMALNALLGGLFGLPESPVVALLPEAVRPMGPWGVRFYWLGLLALPILHLLILVSIYRRSRAIVFKTSPTDSLSLNRSAVIQCVRTELAEEPAIVKHKVILSQAGRRAVDLRVELKVKPIENIPEMQARLGRQIRRALSDVLGLENVRHIKVDVTSIEEPRKRRSDAVPVVRRLEGPKSSSAARRSSGAAAASTSAPAAPEAHEPRDAEFSLDDDLEPKNQGDEFATLSGRPEREEPPSARVYDAGAVQVAPVVEDDAAGPREIDLGEPDAAPEPPPPAADEIKTDDLLEIIGKSKSGHKKHPS